MMNSPWTSPTMTLTPSAITSTSPSGRWYQTFSTAISDAVSVRVAPTDRS